MPISKDNNNAKSPKKKTYKTRSKSKDQEKKLKKHNDSDSDDDISIHSDSEEEAEVEEEMDIHEYRKFLQQIFPSNFLKEKIKKGEKIKNALINSGGDLKSIEKQSDH